MRDTAAEKHNMLRVVDESGEDYLYPKAFFRGIALPQAIRKARAGGLASRTHGPSSVLGIKETPDIAPLIRATLATVFVQLQRSNGSPMHRPKIAQTMVKLAAFALAVSAYSTTVCIADDNDPTVKFYLSLEPDARRLYDTFEPAAAAERERKRRAGEPALTPQQTANGLYAGRELIYNKVLFYPLCADEKFGASGASFERMKRDLQDCVNQKQDQLFEWAQLEKYITVLGDRKFLSCEVKARDFKSERRFPPFEFLRDPHGLKVIDYGKMNDCIKSQL